MSTEGAVGAAAEPMEEVPGAANIDDDDDDDQSIINDDGGGKASDAGDTIGIDCIDLRTTTLKSLLPNWCLHAHQHIKKNPENVLRGWREPGLLSAWDSHTIGEAHVMHSKGLLWLKEGVTQEADEGALPLSHTDEVEQTERTLNQSDDKVVEIPADGVIQASSGITYPLDPRGDPSCWTWESSS